MHRGSHEPPLIPPAAEPDPFVPSTHTSQAADGTSNFPTPSLSFTLQEYKMRNSFATPYLVLTHYTDFTRTHGIVLLKGEITPGENNGRSLLYRSFIRAVQTWTALVLSLRSSVKVGVP
ncbi:hypothetical protein J3R30DRAFT_3417782 [Lentinula aciculospora]|uniref:Uncharacterized protein n=1 Tax=Lentinula aciculospora TaxID=153920 RepID=A0A9W9DX18_9AGAR|nr:hypothetical protein J3R30DRAFT_3417782 [Lentinula aciculospora]